ncbi:hypothetical protein SAMN05444371_3259 [Epilithonimonas mollis]|uniref:Uncharacterized protein n=1 Tax=Epilithonimonas mollis TaxID=216903 RepID=A0A1M6UBB6_9FLAO|nr:hypothetical protein SAMN05444371_3259 [Epilithonimonas mollis]
MLHLKGIKFIGSPDSVVGKEKTSKGTPDSFFVNGDNYILLNVQQKKELESQNHFRNFQKCTLFKLL